MGVWPGSLAPQAVATDRVLGRFLWGNGSLFARRRTLGLFSAGSLFFGAASYLVLRDRMDTYVIVTAFAILLACPVAIAKTATACGVNALHTFSRYEWPVFSRLIHAIIFLATASATAGLLGLLAGVAGALLAPSWLVLSLGPVFLLLGLREFGLIPVLPVPTMRWQVPARWVQPGGFAPIVWGAFLGSGLATWMPHASFYGVLLLAFGLPFPVGAWLMITYGAVRATPALAAAITRRCSGEIALALSWKLRLLGHALTGGASLALAGVLLSALLSDLSSRPAVILYFRELHGDSLTGLVLAVALSGLLASTSLAKLLKRKRFLAVLTDTYQLSVPWAKVTATVVPVAEIVGAGLLLNPSSRLLGFGFTTALFVVMLTGVLAALVRGRTGDCGCLSTIGASSIGRPTLVRLCVLILLCLVGAAQLLHEPVSAPVRDMALAATLALTGIGVAGTALVLALLNARRVLRAFGG